jgi:hypothetical protein
MRRKGAIRNRSVRLGTTARYYVARALGKGPAGRDLTVLADDTFLVSYPRSGNTWLRFLVANALSAGADVSFANIEDLVPDIYLAADSTLLQLPRPRILKSHEPFEPRDVALSYYHFHLKWRRIDDGYPLDEYVAGFVQGHWDRYGTWESHVKSWLDGKDSDLGFLLFRYEDLLSDPLKSLRQISDLLQLTVPDAAAERAIQLSSANRMRELERVQGRRWRNLRGTRKDKPFIGPATAGRGAKKLPSAARARIEEAWAPLMGQLGY